MHRGRWDGFELLLVIGDRTSAANSSTADCGGIIAADRSTQIPLTLESRSVSVVSTTVAQKRPDPEDLGDAPGCLLP
jgi:hypothetical protein